jgi:hypothetical protein
MLKYWVLEQTILHRTKKEPGRKHCISEQIE